jgi:tetratricopeptide (TPR) repeat protein
MLTGSAVSIRHPGTDHPEAYDAVLKADYHLQRGTVDGVARCKAYLEEAIELDPSFAVPYGRLARLTFFMYTGQITPAHDAVPIVRRHAQRALELDPQLSEAHAILGCVAAMYDYDWAAAERCFAAAFAGGAASVYVRIERSNFFLAHAGRGAEAVDDMRGALAEDPLNPLVRWTLGAGLRSARLDAEADARFREVVDMRWERSSAIAEVALSGNRLAEGAVDEALTFAEAAYAHYPTMPAAIGQLAGMLARTGQGDRADALTNQLMPGTTFGAPFGLSLRYLAVGDLDSAADWLEHALEQRDLWVSFLLNVGNIGGRVMWASPRWPKLAKLMNVPATLP